MSEASHIRVAVWAVIVREDKLLLVECNDPGSEPNYHFNLPGGGVELGEPLHAAVLREVWEETTASVEVGEMLFVYEYIPEFEDIRYGNRHVVRPVFRCTLNPETEPRLPDKPDEFQIGVQWVALDQLENIPLIPQIGPMICESLRHPNPRNPYLPAGSEDLP